MFYLVVPSNINEAPWILRIQPGKSISDYFTGHDDQDTRVFEIQQTSVGIMIHECGETDGSLTYVEERFD